MTTDYDVRFGEINEKVEVLKIKLGHKI